MAAIDAVFKVQTPIQLLQGMVKIDNGTNSVLLYVQGVLSRLCEKAQLFAQNQPLPAVFKSPSLKAIAEAVPIIPDLIDMLVRGYFSENLHRFLANHPIPSLLRTFPAPFCGQTDVLDDYFNVTMRTTKVASMLCQANWGNFINELMMEMVPKETLVAARQGGKFNFTAAWTSTSCVVSSLTMSNWTAFMDFNQLMGTFGFLGQNIERAAMIFPRTGALLQLYLQPYLQGYPEFQNFPKLYQHIKEVTIAFESLNTLEEAVIVAEHGAMFAKEFLNVNMTQAYADLIQIKPIVGKNLYLTRL